MRTINMKLKRTVKCKVVGVNGQVKIKFPKQTLGPIAIEFEKSDGTSVITRQWELVLNGDNLVAERLV